VAPFVLAGIVAATLAAVLPLGAAAQATPTAQNVPTDDGAVRLSLPQARLAARQALASGHPAVAIGLAQGLLQADPEDGEAHYIIALARLQSGDPAGARGPVRLAYRAADTGAERYVAARLGARLAYTEKRYTAAQFWLRRAVQNAPDDGTRAKSVRDFRTARRSNPLQFNLTAAISPSDNFNNGTKLERYRIEDSFWVNVPDTSQALSGTRASVTGYLRYRLRENTRSRTSLLAFATSSRARLSDEARAAAPDVKDSDFDYTYAQVGLQHSFLPGSGPVEITFGADLGRRWSAGEPDYVRRALSANVSRRLGQHTRLTFGAQAGDLSFDARPEQDYITREGFASLSHTLPGGDRVSGTLRGTRTVSDNAQQTNDAGAVVLRYAWAKPVGPVRIATSISRNWAHYPTHSYIDSSFRIVDLDGGRKDVNTSLTMDVTLVELDYWGFVPTVSVEQSRTDSNVPGYVADSFGISVGFRSSF
jgi:hypothetical protein